MHRLDLPAITLYGLSRLPQRIDYLKDDIHLSRSFFKKSY
jgi:hypothetical protein